MDQLMHVILAIDKVHTAPQRTTTGEKLFKVDRIIQNWKSVLK